MDSKTVEMLSVVIGILTFFYGYKDSSFKELISKKNSDIAGNEKETKDFKSKLRLHIFDFSLSVFLPVVLIFISLVINFFDSSFWTLLKSIFSNLESIVILCNSIILVVLILNCVGKFYKLIKKYRSIVKK
ncbi:hypothetical protein [uncultured Treponema sp.]|uniref:hypothetical protein n=1 Tax=uncultured Treponema sp. TaxID=162155 RepID=UPI0025D6A1BF|nr:hypothetical protein [uncultured Treponema sp.]